MTRGWRAVFALEIVVCAATCIVWTLAPSAFLEGVFGFAATDLRARMLLSMTANVVACVYVYLYARLLFDRPFALAPFKRLQEAMTLGDVIVLVTSGLEHAWLTPQPAMLAGQVVLAAIWLAIRVAWLWSVRDGATHGEIRSSPPSSDLPSPLPSHDRPLASDRAR